MQTKLERSGSRECIGPSYKKLHILLVRATAFEEMLQVIEEDISVEEVDGNDVELSSAPKEVHYVLKQPMQSECLGYPILFQWLYKP